MRRAALLALPLALGCAPQKPAPPPPAPPPAPLVESALPPSGAPHFEIGRLDFRRSDDGRELYVEGTVKNTGTRTSRDVKVWVAGLDENGVQLARTEALPTPQEIPPGGAARFVVRMPNDQAIRSFKVEAIGR